MSPRCKLHAVSPFELGLRRSSLPAKICTEVGHGGRHEIGLAPSTKTGPAGHKTGASPCLALDGREFGGVLGVIENATLPSSED
jgi:hypothetical protein